MVIVDNDQINSGNLATVCIQYQTDKIYNYSFVLVHLDMASYSLMIHNNSLILLCTLPIRCTVIFI